MKRNTRLHNAALRGLAAIGIGLAAGGFINNALGQDTNEIAAAAKRAAMNHPDFAPYPDRHFPTRVYWGVGHIHTGYSFDAGMFGITLTPDDLFKFCRGGEVVVDNGVRAKIDRPLDWLAITDHAEYLGIADQIREGSPALLANPQGKRWYDMSKQDPEEGVKAAIEAVMSLNNGKPVIKSDDLTKDAWAHAIAAAEKWNQPGVFTALHGFEWTSAPAPRTFIAPSFSATARTA